MRKLKLSLLVFLFIANINATISFSRQDARIRLNNNAILNIGNTISGWSGTLEKRDGASVAGQNINFEEGILLTETSEGFLTGLYNSAGADSIELQGNGRFNGEPGTVVNQFKVRGQNNRLEGQSLFNSQIDFFDASTTLTIALQSKLNQSLNLNGGTLRLEDDLHLADDVYLLGTGTVFLNKKALNLPGNNTTWTTDLDFEEALDIKLNSKTILNGKWSFKNDGLINGNGNILDVSGGGQLELKSNSTLSLVDLYLKGIDSNTFVFIDDSAIVYMSNVDVELEGNVSMTQGGIYVEGTTTFLLKTYDWLFDDSATLTIDGTTLWLDTRIVNPGELKVDKALFVNHYWVPGNDTDGMLSHNFSVLNTGTVRETCCGSTGGGVAPSPEEVCPCAFLYEAPLTADIDLECSCLIHPSKTIRIHDDLTIDGHGATLFFADPEQSQFVVLPGKTVTLKNIQFVRLHANSFDLRAERDAVSKIVVDGKINIDENVEFELSENITFSQGRIILTNASPDIANVFYVRGLAGNKNLGLAPDSTIYADFGAVETDRNLIDTGVNTIALQEIEFRGLEYLKTGVGINFIGAIGLVGGAIVNIGDPDLTLLPDEKEPCDKVFVIEGLENKFALLKNNLYFTGALNFADYYDNAIHFDFVLRERLGNKVVGGTPTLNFATDFVQLTSSYGHARLYFDDDQVLLHNDENAFIVFENSFLDVERLLVENDPIWDFYDPSSGGTPFVIEGKSLEGQGIPNPVVSSFPILALRESRQLRSYKTALSLVYEKEAVRYFSKYRQKETKKITELPLREIDIPAWAESYFNDSLKVVRLENMDQDLGNASGIYLMQNSKANNFYIDQDEFSPLEILMASDSTIEQDHTQSTTLKRYDTIVVAGDNNKIIIKNDFMLLGNIIFDENSELTFEFDERFKDSTLTFSGLNIFDVKQGSRLIFKGRGTVVFSNGFKMKLSEPGLGNKSTVAFQDSTLVRIEENGLSNTSVFRLYGDGNMFVDTGAQITVKEGEHFIVGNSIDDDFNILVDRASVIQLGTRIPCGSQSCGFAKALFSIQKTSVSLDFEQASLLSIRGDGIFEVNALDGTEMRGNLKEFRLDNHGILSIENLGLLRFGRNRQGGGLLEQLIDWDNWNGSTMSECIAMVEYITSVDGLGFAGRIPSERGDADYLANYFQQDDLKAETLVSKLINLVPSLSVSTVYFDIDGNKKVRLMNGTIVDLNVNDKVYADNETTGFVYGSNRGSQFVITLDGTRY